LTVLHMLADESNFVYSCRRATGLRHADYLQNWRTQQLETTRATVMTLPCTSCRLLVRCSSCAYVCKHRVRRRSCEPNCTYAQVCIQPKQPPQLYPHPLTLVPCLPDTFGNILTNETLLTTLIGCRNDCAGTIICKKSISMHVRKTHVLIETT
jgi:hypothetical protein